LSTDTTLKLLGQVRTCNSHILTVHVITAAKFLKLFDDIMKKFFKSVIKDELL